MSTKTTRVVRTTYLYVASLGSLLFLAIGTGMLLNTLLRSYVFPKADKAGWSMCNEGPGMMGASSIAPVEKLRDSEAATETQKEQIDALLKDYERWKTEYRGDECRKAERQSSFATSLAMILVALPLYLIHWNLVRKEKKEKEEESV